jgi:hypothetical protein
MPALTSVRRKGQGLLGETSWPFVLVGIVAPSRIVKTHLSIRVDLATRNVVDA